MLLGSFDVHTVTLGTLSDARVSKHKITLSDQSNKYGSLTRISFYGTASTVPRIERELLAARRIAHGSPIAQRAQLARIGLKTWAFGMLGLG